MQRIENFVFGLRAIILLALFGFTVVMGVFASQLKMDAGFTKMLPIGHPYIETFFEYSESFGGGNRILVVLENKKGDIFQKDFNKARKEWTYPCVKSMLARLSSLFDSETGVPSTATNLRGKLECSTYSRRH